MLCFGLGRILLNGDGSFTAHMFDCSIVHGNVLPSGLLVIRKVKVWPW